MWMRVNLLLSNSNDISFSTIRQLQHNAQNQNANACISYMHETTGVSGCILINYFSQIAGEKDVVIRGTTMKHGIRKELED